MEGSKIISEFQSSKSWDGFDARARVKDFLDNVLSGPKVSKTTPPQCELFCLKILRLSAERLRSKSDVKVCSDIGLICAHNLNETSGLSGKSPKLAFEKILLHFARACLANKLFSECEESMGVLYTQLVKTQETASGGEVELLQHSYDTLWEASVKAKEYISSEKILDLKKLSLKCLLAGKKSNLSTVFEKAQVGDQLYRKAARQKLNPDSDLTSEHYKVLFDFHRGILKIEDYLKKNLSCQMLVPVCQYALVVVKVCVLAQRVEEGNKLLSRTRSLVKVHRCKECVHGDLEALKCQLEAMQVWEAMENGDWLSDKSRCFLQQLSLGLGKQPSLSTTPSVLLKLVETLELVIVGAVQTHKEALLMEAASRDSHVFQHIRIIITTAVTLLNVFLKNPPKGHPATLEQKGRTRQLHLLRFHGVILVNVLTSTMELEGSRSSSCSHVMLSPPRNDIASSFYPVLKQSQDILRKAGTSVCVSEHRWLGADALNIGYALLDHDKRSEACEVFSLGMEELFVWVVDGKGVDTQLSRAKEVQLFEALLVLADMQRSVLDAETALTTLSTTLTSLPVSLLSTSDCVDAFTAVWAKTKEFVSSEMREASSPVMVTSPELLGWTIVERVKKLPDSVKILYLEGELKAGKTCCLSSVALLPAVEALLTLHTSRTERARLTIEKAVLSRGRGQAIILLEEAIAILEQVGGEARAYEQLAIAHLWKAICVGEQIIGLQPSSDASSTTTPNDEGKTRKEVEEEREMALSREEEELMMSDDITQSLHTSVDNWENLLSAAKQLSVSDLSSQYLSLTTQFSLAHSQPLLALRTVKVLLELSPHTHTSTPARVTRLTALALYSDLLLFFGAPSEPQLTELEAVAKERVGCDLCRRETLELSVALATCRLALARVHLSRGQVDSSRSLLLSVLTDSCLKEMGSLPFDLVARAKLLAADLIQQEGFNVKSTSDLLGSMSRGADERAVFKLTPIELVIDASRLMIKLADHKGVREEADTAEQVQPDLPPTDDLNKAFTDANTLEEATPTFSSNVGAWHILVGLLESLRRVTTLYLCQGHLRKAQTKAREGAMMARQVLLQGWYMEFLLLLTEIHTMLGSYHLSSLHSTQVATLLDFPLPVSLGGSKDGDDTEGNKDKKNESEGAKERGKEPQCADVSLMIIDSDSLDSSDSSDSFSSTFSSTLLQGQERFSPPTHPPQCDCRLCSDLIANGHLGRMLSSYCSNTLDQTLHTMGQSSSQQEQDKLKIISTQLMSILHKGKEILSQRKQQYETILSGHLQPKKELKKKSKSTKKYSPSIPTHPAFIVGLTDLSLTIGDCHLALLQPRQAIDHINATLTELGLPRNLKEVCGYTHHHHQLSLCLARAQYTLGVARLQQIEHTQPELTRRIWSNLTTVVDKENEGAVSSAVKKSTRSATKTRRTRNTKVLSEINATKEDTFSRLKSDCLKPKIDAQFPSEPLDHLILSYQLGVVLGSSELVRECCRWLCVLLSMEASTADLCPLFLAESMAVSLSHHASLTMGVKIRSQVSSKSPLQHASETVSTITPHTPSQATPSSLERARHALHTPSHPSLPHDWVMCTIAPAPFTHYTHPQHILISRISEEPKSKKAARSKSKPPGQSTTVFLKMSLPTGGLDNFLKEFNDLQKRMSDSMKPCDIHKWWAARRQLDTEMEQLFARFERDYVCAWLPPLSLSAGGAVILVLGERVVGLPWESLSLLADKVVCRMPSLKFTTAHMHMTEHRGEVTVNQDSAFYVLNPGGDLLKTQSVFASWFNTQEGWEGVVGRPPTDTEYTSALQSKDLYVYCGHSFGNYLTSSGFQQLSCRSTALLLGCSSARLQEGGRSDPMGPTLNFLMSGSPSVVGCLWNVSDGEIDRFSRALFKSTKKSRSYLSTMVAESKQACKLPWVTGAAAVVYGVPVTFRD